MTRNRFLVLPLAFPLLLLALLAMPAQVSIGSHGATGLPRDAAGTRRRRHFNFTAETPR